MNRHGARAFSALGLAVVVTASLAACSGSTPQSSADQKVTITIGDRPAANQPANRKLYDAQVASFEKANPKITLKPTETIYDATTFSSLLAGGNLPDTLSVPFTEAKGLIANGQTADLTSALKTAGLTKSLNKTTLKVIQDSSGKVFGVPVNAYSIGLAYNRALFTKAGLDPNKPPTTWDEVRTDAKKITAATGVPGFETLGTKNQGGWILSAMTYSYGGSIENADGTKTTFNKAPAKAVLKNLQEMRWTDKSMGPNGLYDLDSMSQDFAAGKVGMWIAAPDVYNAAITNNKMNKNDFGEGPMPQNGGVNGTLTGGTLEIVSPKATDAERVAAVKWINWNYLRQYEKKDQAISVAEAATASNTPVGLPGLSVVSDSTNAQYLDWIKDKVDVPISNFEPYLQTTASIPIQPEPVNKAQEVYAALDPVVQAVLTNKNANVDQLLSNAAKSIDSQLGR
ncbi:sugar ABC transporter substrate-binding protein [Frondihabitans sucicola]|uniref:Sugar ABC transporter substrate-binding protein n=1 Tax=Frondihabitans sucicola TaxID=1268041 RepID=A0ABN6XWN6_9MICO|nr:extracellular solute-binding protein [Frondihabitans sucicola]BDZ49390.1 sugar ABC transporter substrate-binding protein [Frondihabitans sucicola]